jgi:ABC-type branched-subunit amino acid transport system substrate-binding protein
MRSSRSTAALLTAVLIAAAGFLASSVAGCRGTDVGATEGKGGIKTDVGVTDKACPDAVNKDNGCIYLGTISDLTEGPFAAISVQTTEAQKVFWKKVNEAGGIGGYDVDVTKYTRDNKYNPEIHNQVYQEIKPDVLALAQTLGSATTAAILPDLKKNDIVGAPASWTSGWAFEDVILESGASYCIESMNSVDYAAREFAPKSVMAVHYKGDYGGDAAAGAKTAAEANKLPFTDVETQQGQENQGGAIDKIVSGKPDLVILTTGSADAATVVGQAAARGYRGRFIGTAATWNPGLVKSPAFAAMKAQYLQSRPVATFESDTEGHKAMRAALGDVQGNDGYTFGWVWSYPLKAALQKAAENKDLTRKGLLKAVKGLKAVDYEGMMPPEAGNYAGDPNDSAVRETQISRPDETVPSGVSQVTDFFAGQTAKDYRLDKPCFAKG